MIVRENDGTRELRRPASDATLVRRCGWLLSFEALTLLACSSTQFVSTWKAPGVEPFNPKGAKVVALVMVESQVRRREAEDRLAAQLTKRGAAGIPMYLLTQDHEPLDEELARQVLHDNDISAVVVMRPRSEERRVGKEGRARLGRCG